MKIPVETVKELRSRTNVGIADCNKAIELDPECVDAYYVRAYAYKEKGKTPEAIADFKEFISLTKDPQLIELARQQIEELSK